MSVLSLPRTVYNAIRAHGEETYPRECCGALLGSPAPEGWTVELAIRGCDTHNGNGHGHVGQNGNGHNAAYTISETEMNKIERLAQNLGLHIAGFYHSHPDQSAQWSPGDFAEARRIGCSYVITEVGRGKAAATIGFLLAGTREENKYFEAQEIHLLH